MIAAGIAFDPDRLYGHTSQPIARVTAATFSEHKQRIAKPGPGKG